MSFDFSTLVTDRTHADVSRVQELASKIRSGTASESELAEFNSAAMKGAYNYTDLNRVTAAMEALKAKLEGYGYNVPGYQRIKVPHVLPEPEPTSRLPEGYTQVEYIQSSGTQYIDALFKPNQDTRVVGEFEATALRNYRAPFGVRTGLAKSVTTLVGLTQAFYNYGDEYAFADYGNTYERMTIDANKNVATFTGSETVTISLATATFTAEYNLLIGSYNNGGTAAPETSAWVGKIYYCQVYDNGALVRDYVPCINPSGDVGLFDVVNKQFYGNSGTGSFVAGSIPRTLPEGYTQVEYIKSSKTQYIDTGFKPNQNTRIVMDCNLTGGDLYPAPFGTWDAVGKSQFICLSFSATQSYYYHGTANTEPQVSILGRHTLDGNKNSLYVDGVLETTLTKATFQCSYPLHLFTMSDAGKPRANNMAAMLLYSCQIYDNGTLIRDYVPCKNSNGAFGLYDMVNDEFYQNAGSGTFAAGEEIVAPATASVMVASGNADEYDPYTWYEFDWPTPETMTVYLLNVSVIRAVLAVMKSTPNVPTDMVGLMVQEANDIEKILVDVNELLEKSALVWFYSGDLFAGEVD